MEMTAERNIEAQLRSAAKIEPERLSRLKLLAADWAEAGARALNASYAAPVEIAFSGLSGLLFTPAQADIRNAVAATMIGSVKWQEPGFALADAGLADTLVEAVFGGSGQAAAGTRRPMTKLDRRFMEQAFAALVDAANPVFQTVAALDMVPGRFLHDAVGATLDELLPRENRAFVQLAFRISVGQYESTIRIALPERALAPHRRKLTVLPDVVPPVTDEGWARDITEGLQLADLEVRALLDEQQITLGEVARFTLGQTIVLDATMDSLIIVECEEQRLFRGRMGRSRDSYVVRIEEKIDPTEEFIDDILSD